MSAFVQRELPTIEYDLIRHFLFIDDELVKGIVRDLHGIPVQRDHVDAGDVLGKDIRVDIASKTDDFFVGT